MLPSPIPVSLELPTSAGWGISEAESGQSRGAGLDLYGVRGYVSGDPLRQVHWRSTARTGELMVKEFEAGSHTAAAFVIQRTRGSEIGEGAATTLEAMCGHAVFLAETFLRQGARVEFPSLEASPSRGTATERVPEIYELLAGVQADREETVGTEVLAGAQGLPPGSIVFVLISVQDRDLLGVATELRGRGIHIVALVYDAAVFAKRKSPSRIPLAADPEYLEVLRSAGAQPVVMPVEGVDIGTAASAR